MSTQNDKTIQSYDNSKKSLDEQTSSYNDSGFITESCDLTGDQSKEIETSVDNKLLLPTPQEKADMTKATSGNSQSKDSEIENYTDSGIVSCSNISSVTATSSEIQSKAMLVKDLQPYVPAYLIRKKIQPQHPNLQIEKYFEQDEDGYTKLHIAILHNIEPAIQVLINCAPNAQYLNLRNYCGQTAMHLAVLMQQSQTVRKLIDAGADMNVRDNRCNSPLHLAVLNQDVNCLSVILSAVYPGDQKRKPIANLEQWNYDGETCFYAACKQRNIPMMKLLANSGADVNAREGRSGYTSLHLAVETNASDVVKFLCENNIDVLDLDCGNYGGYTAFQLCLLTNQELMAEYLMKKGATPYYTCDTDDDEDLDETVSDIECEFEELEKNQLVNKIAEIAVN